MSVTAGRGSATNLRRDVGVAADPTRGDLSRALALVSLGVCTAVNGALGLYHLGSRSVWSDEAATWMIVDQHGARFLSAVAHEGGDMLVYYVLLHFLVVPFSSSATALRSLSVVAGVATVPAIYGLGCAALRRRWAGLACAAITAVDVPLVFWQQNARAYSLDALLAVVTTWAFLLAVRDGSRRARVIWVVSSILAVGTHPLAVLLAMAQLSSVPLLRLDRDQLRQVAKMVLAAAIGCVPLAILFLARGGSQISWLTRPNWATTKEVLDFLSGGTAGYGKITTVDPVTGIIGVITWIVGFVLLAFRYGQRGRSSALYGPSLIAASLLVPLVLAYTLSRYVVPVVLDRYLLILLPAATVLVVYVLQQIRWRVITAIGLTGLVYLHTVDTLHSYGRSLEQNASVASYLVEHAESGDCLAFYTSGERLGYDFYTYQRPSRAYPRQILPSEPNKDPLPSIDKLWDATASSQAAYYTPSGLSRTTSCVRLWLLVGHAGSPEGSPMQRRNYLQLIQLEARLRSQRSAPVTTSFGGAQLSLYGEPRSPKG